MFADVHSHILFGIDDGARNVNETKRHLVQLHRDGITHLAFTPHYYPHKESLRSFLKRREEAFLATMELPEMAPFHISLGAEVYCGETLFNNEDLSPLCYAGTNYMLTELEYSDTFTEAAKYRLLRLIEDYNVIPVLAHIDRYPFLKKDLKLLAQLKKMGCRFQVNLSAMAGFFSRRQVIKLYENGFLDFLGADLHRTPLSSEERKEILSRTEKSCKGLLNRVSCSAAQRLFVTE